MDAEQQDRDRISDDENRQSSALSQSLSAHEQTANDSPTVPNSVDPQQGKFTCLMDYFEALKQTDSDAAVISSIRAILSLDRIFEGCYSGRKNSRLFEAILTDVAFHVDDEAFIASLLDPAKTTLDELRRGPYGLLAFAMTCPKTVTGKEFAEKNGGGSLAFHSISQLLHHIQILRLRVNGNTFYNELDLKGMSVLTFAFIMEKPGIVLCLLQYGARFSDQLPGFSKKTLSTEQICTRALFSDIITEILEYEMWDFENMKLKTDFSGLPEETKSKCLKFLFLMRSIPNPYVTTLALAGTRSPQGWIPEIHMLRHIYDSLFPGLGFGRSRPPQLQHMCKCVIRQRLFENWQLPDGISKLELSKILIDYLNLIDD